MCVALSRFTESWETHRWWLFSQSGNYRLFVPWCHGCSEWHVHVHDLSTMSVDRPCPSTGSEGDWKSEICVTLYRLPKFLGRWVDNQMMIQPQRCYTTFNSCMSLYIDSKVQWFACAYKIKQKTIIMACIIISWTSIHITLSNKLCARIIVMCYHGIWHLGL